jgi:hypothetical protein
MRPKSRLSILIKRQSYLVHDESTYLEKVQPEQLKITGVIGIAPPGYNNVTGYSRGVPFRSGPNKNMVMVWDCRFTGS